jgi:DNA processing protein
LDSEEGIKYQIALTLVPGVGSVLGRKLVNLAGKPEALFREPEKVLKGVPRINHSLFESFRNREILPRAEKELEFIRRFRIKPVFFTNPMYPFRLRSCIDSPLMLYYKGNADLNCRRVVGVVGTRNITDYGREACHLLISGLAEDDILVVSGLAYGVDSCAHRVSLEKGLSTVGVLGHGLDRIYPEQNRPLAEKMVGHGGLLTEFMSETRPDRENFPMRNRIIAGLCDAIVVVEAAEKGGALITAEIANSYNRDVFAVPGRISDKYSEGANRLISSNKAAIVRSAEDLRYMMGWDLKEPAKPAAQRKIFIELTAEEQTITEILAGAGRLGIDELCIRAKMSMGKVSAALVNLEFEGIVKCLPGKIYCLC